MPRSYTITFDEKIKLFHTIKNSLYKMANIHRLKGYNLIVKLYWEGNL